MPLRRRDDKPSKNVTLNEALNWIAFDSFYGPSRNPAALAAEILGDVDVEALQIEEYSQQTFLEPAKEDFIAALRDGDIPAHGRYSDQHEHNWHAEEWTQQTYENRSEKRTKIPPEFWRHEGINWDYSCARSQVGEYDDIILSREDVLALWPMDVAQEGEDPASYKEDLPRQPEKKRGPKERYPENEFYALCALEITLNDLPETQAQMVDQMAQLLGVIWGEDRVPGDTWLKEKVGRIYKLQEKYEAGRQQIEKEIITDRSEPSK